MRIPEDSLKAALDTVLSRPVYQWTPARNPFAWLGRAWNDLIDWLFRLREANPAAWTWFLWGLVLVLVAILVHGGWILSRTLRGAGAAEVPGFAGGKIEFRDEAWYRRRAASLAEEGRYAAAMQASFQALILHLDAGGVLRYHAAKTPREYAAEAKLPEAESHRLSNLVRSLYGFVYARHDCSPEEYSRWREEASGPWHAAAN